MRKTPRQHAKNIEDIYRQESGSLLRSLRRLLPSLDERWDVVQEVFTRLLTGRDLGHVKTRKSFFRRAVTNQVIDQLRRRKRWDNIEQLLPQDPQSSQPSPEEEYEAAEQAVLIARAMAALPQDERIALTLVRFEELTIAEAAVRMGRKEHIVRRRIARALLRLQAAVEAESGDAHE